MARKMFKFWLDDKQPGDWQLNELIDQLKAARQFSRAIRDGLRLWSDLAGGGVSVLLELHPDIKERLSIQQKPAPVDPDGLKGEIAELKQLIIQQGGIGAPPPDYPLMKSNKAAPAPQIEITTATVDPDAIFDDFMAFIQ